MSELTRARLDVQKLDDRTVPSAVTATATARPFDFVATGTFATTTVDTSGPVALTSSASTAVTLNGQIDYTSNTDGAAALVSIAGTGTGSETPVNPSESGGRGSFAQTVQGQLSIADSSGTVTTPTSLTGTVNWFTPTGGSGIELIGPQSLTGSFDPANFQLQAGWTTTTSVGSIAVTLAGKTSSPTDLAFGEKSAELALDGSLSLDFTALVTGDLMRAASHTMAAATVTAMWEDDNGQTAAADLNVAIYWNTGSVSVKADGLTPPAWAKRLTVKLDAAGIVSEGNENNNAWTVNLSDLAPPLPPPPPPPPPPVATYGLVPGEQPMLQWISASGQILAQRPAIDGFSGPVHLATGDVNGDGILDVVVGAGTGGAPRVRVLDGQTGVELANFFAYDSAFRGGVHIALADLNGDGVLSLVTGAGEGGGPHVRILDPVTSDVVREFFAFDPESRSGVAVAAGDLDGDGMAEILAAPASGEGRILLVLDGLTGAERFRTTLAEPQPSASIDLKATFDPTVQAVVVTIAPDDDTPLVKFRSQLADGEALLVPLPVAPLSDPLLFNPVAMG